VFGESQSITESTGREIRPLFSTIVLSLPMSVTGRDFLNFYRRSVCRFPKHKPSETDLCSHAFGLSTFISRPMLSATHFPHLSP
jgi:hypothetical protein